MGGGCPNCRTGGNPPKIPLFHGEPGEWPSFYFAFRQVVNGETVYDPLQLPSVAEGDGSAV